MKKLLKRVCEFALVVAMVIGTSMVVSATELPTDVTTPRTGNVLVTMDGEYLTAGKAKILTRLNEIREEACTDGVENPASPGHSLTLADYKPLKWSQVLEKIAQIRAGEQGINGLSHSRPNGDAPVVWIYTLGFDGKHSWGENIAGNSETTDTTTMSAIEQWYGEKQYWVGNNTEEDTGHYTSIINPNYNYTGLMSFYSGKGYKFTAQEFSFETGLDESEVGNTGAFSQVVEVDPSTLTITMSGAAELQPAATSTYALSAVATKVKSQVNFKTPIVWSSTDTSKATINSSTGKLTAVADGTTTVKATCNDVVLATKKVTVRTKNVTGISVTTPPTKTEYVAGQDFNPAGGKLTVTCDDTSTEQVDLSKATISGYNKNTTGEQTLTATYAEKTANFKVTVIAKTATSIEVTTKPKVAYIEGQNFDPTGGKVTVTYNDDSTKEVDLTAAMVSGYNKNTIGEQNLTVTTEGKETTLKVNVSEKQVDCIAIKTKPTKDEYVVGQSNDVSGGVITVTYDNGTTADVNITSSMVTGFDSSAVATGQTLTVTYGGKTTTYTVNIVAKAVTSIEVTTPPTKTAYIEGQDINVAGGKLTATYNDGSTQEVAITAAMLSGYNKDTIGTQHVTVTYESQTATFDVTVAAKKVTGIDVKTNPTKMTYKEGKDTLDLSGGQLEVTYDNGTKATIAMNATGVTNSGFNNTVVGSNTITFTYEGKTTTLPVTIEAKKVSSIEVTAPTKTSYVKGQNIDVTGGKVKVNYDNDTNETIDMTSGMLSNYNPNTTGTQHVKVTYEGKDDTFDVTVIAKVVDSIDMKTNPTKVTYKEGKELDLTGGKITATFNDASTADIDLSSCTISGYDKTKIGSQTVTVKYEGKTTTFNVTVEAKAIDSIEMKTKPSKLTYKEGQDLVLTGGVIKVNYDNDTTKDVTLTADMISGYDKTKTGTQAVTVTYKGKTATFDVTVNAKQVSSIALKTAPTKTTYIEGQDLVLTGGKITVSYDNGTSEDIDITSSMISGYKKNTIGSQAVTVTYGGKTTTFNVTVNAKQVSSIAVKTHPTKMAYLESKDTLDLTDGELEVTYDNGAKETIAMTATGVTNSGFDNTKVGTNTITLTYNGKTTTLDVTITAKQVSSIALKDKPTTLSYIEGQDLDLTGGVIKVNYDNDTTKDVTLTSDMVSGYDKNKTGSQTVTVTYGGKTATFDLNVIAKQVTGIVLKSKPTKLEYIEAQDLDLTGGKITVSYDNGLSEDIAITSSMISGYDKTKLGKQTVTVTYGGKTATFEVTVKAKQVSSIAVKTNPNKMSYLEAKETLDLTGGEIEITYDNGTTETIAMTKTGVTCSGFDNTKVGPNTMTLTYSGKTTSLVVTINAKQVSSIALKDKPTKLSYIEGQDLDLTGGIITASYDNDTTKDVTLTSDMISGYDKNKTGLQTVIVTYGGKTATFDVNIIAKQVTGVVLKSKPTKVTYVEGEDLDLTGANITVSYDNGLSEDIAITSSMISGYDKAKLGKQTVTVTYAGKTFTFEVTVELPKYVFTDGMGQTTIIGSDKDLTFRVNGPLELLDKVYVNNQLLDAANYTTASGSTIITLNKEYVMTLSAGTYTLKATYTNGVSASTDFMIEAKETKPTNPGVVVTPTNPNQPTDSSKPTSTDKSNTPATQTGDDSQVGLWTSLLSLSGLMSLGYLVLNKKRKMD